jgi:hypothetical protein
VGRRAGGVGREGEESGGAELGRVENKQNWGGNLLPWLGLGRLPDISFSGPPGLEMGPQPQGVLRADLFSRMRALVASILDFIELFNQGETPQ